MDQDSIPKIRNNRFPLRISIAPDIFQDRTCQLFKDIELVGAYFDDLLVVTHGVMRNIDAGSTCCNYVKAACCFPIHIHACEARIGISRVCQSNPDKVQANLDSQRPTNNKKVH
jgi:hypothetical protein